MLVGNRIITILFYNHKYPSSKSVYERHVNIGYNCKYILIDYFMEQKEFSERSLSHCNYVYHKCRMAWWSHI